MALLHRLPARPDSCVQLGSRCETGGRARLASRRFQIQIRWMQYLLVHVHLYM